MTNSVDTSESGNFTNFRKTKMVGKSTFLHTCNLLNQYMKEKGNLSDLTLRLTSDSQERGWCNLLKSASTVDLLPRDQISEQNAFVDVKFGLSELQKDCGFRSFSETEVAQMTIIYSGKVYVFDNFPAKKAQEVIFFASHGRSLNSVDSSDNGINQDQEHHQQTNQIYVPDLPMARKVSLQRFLQKRKDRISSKAPYQNANSGSSSKSSAEPKPWLGLTS